MTKFGNKKFKSAHVLGRKFTHPIIIHAVPDKKTFFSILNEGIIKTPLDREFQGNHRFMNKHLNIHNCVYFSAGWEYNATYHHWPLAFIFSTSLLKEKGFETFRTFIISQAWMNVLRYWRDKDPEYLAKLSDSSRKARDQVRIFLKKDACSFWLFEDELENHLSRYKDKKKIFSMLAGFRKKHLLSNTYAPQYVKKHYFEDEYTKRIEVVSHKSVSLKSMHFIGLYVERKMLKSVLPKLKKHLNKGVLVFDGINTFELE